MKIRLFLMIFLSFASFSITIRENDDIEEFLNFANNIGKYEPNKTNIIVYDKFNNKEGVIKYLIPDFSQIADQNLTPIGDSQFYLTVRHMTFPRPVSVKSRFMQRKDVELFSDYKNRDKSYLSNLFSDNLNVAFEKSAYIYDETLSKNKYFDYKIYYSKHVAFDVIPYEFLPEDKQNLVVPGSIVARSGYGAISYINSSGVVKTIRYSDIAGGFSKLNHVMNDPKHNPGVTMYISNDEKNCHLRQDLKEETVDQYTLFMMIY